MPADILLPQVEDMSKWAVIACDQFSSNPAYWERVRLTAGDSPSTINLILPEAELGDTVGTAFPFSLSTACKQGQQQHAAQQHYKYFFHVFLP